MIFKLQFLQCNTAEDLASNIIVMYRGQMVYGLAESGEDIHSQTAGTRVVTCQAIKLMVETDLSLHYVADRSLKDQSF